MKIATYLQNNSVVQEFADWFKEESGRDDFFLGAYTDGELFIEIEGVEMLYSSAIRFIKKKPEQEELNLIYKK